MEEYDAVVAGASFAGLSVASRLRAKVLLIDKYDIGTFQISACGAPYDVIKGIGCKDSVLQTSNIFSFHVNRKRIDIHLEKPYCTFDFAKLCQTLNSKCDADFLRARVTGIEKIWDLFTVNTSEGDISCRILVDATGWNASVAEKLSPNYVDRTMLSFGIETEVPYECDSFHFFYEPDFLTDGVSWIFPSGEYSRIGVLSYTGPRKLIGKLDSFLERFSLKRQKVHGGIFCYCLKEPIVEDVFVVGCAQGQTLPLTGEDIRRCIRFWGICGEIIQKVLHGHLELREGLNEYARQALKTKGGFNFMLKAQNRFLKMSEKNIEVLARIISNRLISKLLERCYRKI